jgi:hypothetical protein
LPPQHRPGAEARSEQAACAPFLHSNAVSSAPEFCRLFTAWPTVAVRFGAPRNIAYFVSVQLDRLNAMQTRSKMPCFVDILAL